MVLLSVPSIPLWPILNGSLVILVFALALTRLRGTWFALLAGANAGILLVLSHSVDQFESSPWRLQVFVQRFMELPLVCGVAALCLVQSRRMTFTEDRLRKALRAAPALLIGAWVISLAGEQVWPHPSLDLFAKMPLRNWALLTVLCVPLQLYLWGMAFVFFRTAALRSPTLRLKLQNFLLALAIAGAGLTNLNVVADYAVRTFAANPDRIRMVLLSLAIEDRLFFLWGPALLGGLLLAAFPVAVREVRAADALALLPLRERFEGLLWRLEVAGSLRRLTRPLYHLQAAAMELNLSKADTAKAVQTLKLAAVMNSPKAPSALSREKARELLLRLDASDQWQVHPPASWSLGGFAGSWGTSESTHLPEILRASLSLTSPNATPPDDVRPAWLNLVRSVCSEEGITSRTHVPDPGYECALKAYRRVTDQAVDA